jgi:hypothetical protein
MTLTVTGGDHMNTTHARSTTSTGLRRKITSALVALSLVAGMIGAMAEPTHAATQVTACYQWDTGAAYANQPVSLVQWNGSSWVPIRSGRTGGNGCGTFYNVPSNVYVSMRVHLVLGNSSIGQAIYASGVPSYGAPGNFARNLGTIRLTKTCVQGLYGYCAGLN